MGYWKFAAPLQIGDTVIFEDMIHYTTVKTNMFNGIHHPSLKFERLDGTIETLREYRYEDYRDRMTAGKWVRWQQASAAYWHKLPVRAGVPSVCFFAVSSFPIFLSFYSLSSCSTFLKIFPPPRPWVHRPFRFRNGSRSAP